MGMIDAREQIGDALESVCENVKMAKPDGDAEFPLICYACIADDIVGVGYDRLRWKVTAYNNTFEGLIEMVKGIDAVMNGQLGYTRTKMMPDDETKKGVDFYMNRLEYSALVNLEAMAVIRGST